MQNMENAKKCFLIFILVTKSSDSYRSWLHVHVIEGSTTFINFWWQKFMQTND